MGNGIGPSRVRCVEFGWIWLFFGRLVLRWHTGRDLNPQPSDPKSDALSIELPVRQRIMENIFGEGGGFVKF